MAAVLVVVGGACSVANSKDYRFGAAGGEGGAPEAVSGAAGMAGESGSAAGGASGTAGGANIGGAGAGGAGAGGAGAGPGGAGSGASPSAGEGGAPEAGGSAGAGGAGGSAGQAGGGGTGPIAWCDQQLVPAGVLPADYQCLDFDSDLPPTAVWVQSLARQGSLMLTNGRASSLPNSLETLVSAAADFNSTDTATLTWSDVGASAITGVSVSADLSTPMVSTIVPDWTGYVELLCVEFGSGRACLVDTVRGAPSFATAPYTGLYVSWIYTGGAAVRGDCPVTGNLTANLWTRVGLRADGSSGAIDVSLSGASATAQCSGAFSNDTVAKVTVGNHVVQTTTNSFTTYYDNVVAYVAR